MSLYARIANGAVVETFSPPMGFTLAECFTTALAAQFIDVTGTSPPPQSGWTATENVGVWSFAVPPAPVPSPAQNAQAAIAAGLTISSTGTPAIDGTFAIDTATQGKIAAVEVYILKNSVFPGGVTTYPWPVLAGEFVTFPDTTAFQNWATAICDYVSVLNIIIASNSGTLPSASVTIA